MKYIRIISTLLVLLFVAHFIDTVYVKLFKTTLDSLTGFYYVGYYCLVALPRIVIGCCLGTNLVRISNWMWNTADFKNNK